VYAKISDIENKYISLLTNYQVVVTGENEVFNPRTKPSFTHDIAKRCATRQMICIYHFINICYHNINVQIIHKQ
jgi:hypothetical protein